MKSTTDYQGDFQYENGILQFISQPEGYIYKDATGYRYVYQYRDHLGNNRLSFMRNAGTVAIVKETNYYPFGLTQKGYNNLTTSLGSAGAKKYQYNGKELQDELGLNLYDYGARFYDAGLGRWIMPDPLAEYHLNYTPYNFTFNNPINFIDPFGMDTVALQNLNMKHYNPNKDVVNLPEVTVRAKKPNKDDGILYTMRKIFDKIKNYLNSYEKGYGEPWSSENGQGEETSRAKKIGPGGNIDLILALDPAGRLELPKTNLERLTLSVFKANEAINAIPSDKEIIDKNTGTAKHVYRNGVDPGMQIIEIQYIDSGYVMGMVQVTTVGTHVYRKDSLKVAEKLKAKGKTIRK